MSIAPPTDRRAIDRFLSPLVEFTRLEAAGGILLLICTAVAVAWANSPWRGSYFDFWHMPVAIEIGSLRLSESLAHWVNDGLMAIFFFVVGLEIKRELLVGELASPRKAAIPVAAAVGGMAVPALVYALVNFGGNGMAGWAIPAATDIAFALGIMALLGKRVPLSLKVFLMALAIVDDIGAVLVIAFFYTSDVSWSALGAAGAVLALLVVANILHVRKPIVYVALGLLLWVAFLLSGIHATLAGVLLAFTIPSQFRIRGADFIAFSRHALDEFERAGGNENDLITNQARQRWVHGLEMACEHVDTPLLRLEHALVPWVALAIMPIFALANAGVEIGGGIVPALGSRISLGIILGLVLGKQIGIMGCTWLAVRLGLGTLPEGLTWKHIYATSWLAGIGFTMSLFIAYLGFGEGEQLVLSKYGILAGSLAAGVVGYVLLRLATRPRPGPV
ncbi:MAG: Na+/H+ antiporter NhaA [Planctomycetota bacterium]|jgi:NhaA family Na+:H+ antiporter